MSPMETIKPTKLADYLEIMSRSAFQAGISWRVVESKWAGIKVAFHDFDPARIAKFTVKDIDALMDDARVIRNRRKIEAIVSNAQRLIELDQKSGGFKKYLRSFDKYDDLAKDLKKQFKFLGDTGTYMFLWTIGEKVPSHEEWSNRYGK